MLRISSKTSIAVGGFLFMCGFGDICSLLILVFLTCVWTVKHQLKQSSIWELQTPKWLQKSCLHLYQQRTECDDSFLFSLSLSLFFSFSFFYRPLQLSPSPLTGVTPQTWPGFWGTNYSEGARHEKKKEIVSNGCAAGLLQVEQVATSARWLG